MFSVYVSMVFAITQPSVWNSILRQQFKHALDDIILFMLKIFLNTETNNYFKHMYPS